MFMNSIMFFFLGFIIFSIAFIIVFFVIIKLFIKNAKQISTEEEYVRAEVLRTNTKANGFSLQAGSNYDHTQYFVEFYTDFGKTLVLTCNKRTYSTLLPGHYGDLVYKGTKLISFIRLVGHEEAKQERLNEEGYFFQKKGPKNTGVFFYCDAPSLNIKIPTDQPIEVDYGEVKNYLSRLFDNETDNFFGLDNHNMTIQFWHDGKTDEIGIDIPVPSENGSYQAIINGIDTCLEIVEAFFEGESVYRLANFELIKFK